MGDTCRLSYRLESGFTGERNERGLATAEEEERKSRRHRRKQKRDEKLQKLKNLHAKAQQSMSKIATELTSNASN